MICNHSALSLFEYMYAWGKNSDVKFNLIVIIVMYSGLHRTAYFSVHLASASLFRGYEVELDDK